MIKPYEITIGSVLKTNQGDIIIVDSISTKSQHRKVGYHKPNDAYHLKYVRLAQCDGVPLTKEILDKVGIRYQFGVPWYQLSYPHEINIGDIIMICPFVHQLQNLLHICGLDEMAEKLKACV